MSEQHPQPSQAPARELRGREQEISDLKVLLASREGRRFIWRLLSHCKVFGSIWHASAQIHHNAGKQDVGHFLLAEIAAANDEALLIMMRESKEESSKVPKPKKEENADA